MGVAFFDLDGTITKKDTYLEFIKFSKGKFNFFIGLFILSPFIILYYFKVYPNDKLKELFFNYFFKNSNVTELERIGDEFGMNVMPNLVYDSAIKKIRWHQSKGDQIIILTASSPIWLTYWCRLNNFELIGTTFETVNGKYTGKILGKNCFGLQKKKIVKEYLMKHAPTETYGYGDSKSDLHFLKELKYYFYGALK